VTSVTMANAFTVNPAPPAQLAVTASAVTASTSANAAVTIIEKDAFGFATSTSSPLTVGLSSTSPNRVFALSSGGASTNSATIPAGSSSVTVYYGDTAAGSPVLSATSPGLLTG